MYKAFYVYMLKHTKTYKFKEIYIFLPIFA